MMEKTKQDFLRCEDEYLRSKDVREMFNISDSTLQSWRIKRVIPAYKMGSMWIYRKDDIIKALMVNRVN